MSSATTRQRVIDAALELFMARGYDGVSMAEISRASGVSHGSIFHHFGSKDGVAIEVYLLERRTYWEAVISALEAAPVEGPETGLDAAVRAALAYQEANPGRHTFMIECASADWMRRHAEPVQVLNRGFEARFAAWAGPWMAAGRLPVARPETYAALVFGAGQWLARSWLTGLTGKPPGAYADELSALVVRALVR